MTPQMLAFLNTGGPALWAIAVLSVLVLAIVLWKLWRLSLMGAWSHVGAEAIVAGHSVPPKGLRARFAVDVLGARRLPDGLAREEVMRLAGRVLVQMRSGLRPLELIATIAPLIGLLGTVLGMIDAFQALETTGGQADPAVLAGGIWEALLTTAAGMGVAIPAAIALSWFEAIAERVQGDMEDIATRIFTQSGKAG
jgi:biopolymer transport protein ExbB